jgi:diacylglycerol O-acyltransferase 1
MTWALHIAFSVIAPVAAAVLVCNASEPSPLFAMAFMMASITLVLKLVNFSVHQWHCRELARHSGNGEEEDTTQVHLPAVTARTFGYFMLAPTLNFAVDYPAGPPFNGFRLARRLCYLAATLLGMAFVISQLLEPLWGSMVAVGSAWPPRPAEYALIFVKLSLPVFLVWLGAFVAFFHLWLSILAEVTGFGDRRFFLDWWNAPNMKEFWSRWNLPVHRWALTSVQAPLKRLGVSPAPHLPMALNSGVV